MCAEPSVRLLAGLLVPSALAPSQELVWSFHTGRAIQNPPVTSRPRVVWLPGPPRPMYLCSFCLEPQAVLTSSLRHPFHTAPPTACLLNLLKNDKNS